MRPMARLSAYDVAVALAAAAILTFMVWTTP